ncbi:MAG: acylphosphatase [Planctomycetes bacterium]|nr:acylphosphatase [Planctomycetota bacterium]
MSNQRREVRFYGTVQGVGFRYTACRVAELFDVTGFVRNMPDGGVECVIEGPAEQIDGFLAELSRRMGGHIRSRSEQLADYTGSFTSFGVKF